MFCAAGRMSVRVFAVSPSLQIYVGLAEEGVKEVPGLCESCRRNESEMMMVLRALPNDLAYIARFSKPPSGSENSAFASARCVGEFVGWNESGVLFRRVVLNDRAQIQRISPPLPGSQNSASMCPFWAGPARIGGPCVARLRPAR